MLNIFYMYDLYLKIYITLPKDPKLYIENAYAYSYSYCE